MAGIVLFDRAGVVTIGERQIRQAAVLLDGEGRAVVVTMGPNGFEIAARGTGASWTRNRETKQIEVTTSEGEVWSYDRAGGCGCGSPFKRLNREAALAGTL